MAYAFLGLWSVMTNNDDGKSFSPMILRRTPGPT
jgi:hypothetical protein